MTYTPRQHPYKHQTEAVAKAGGKVAFGYLMETGTGKSGAALDEWGAMEEANVSKDLLIIAPAGCYSNWTDDKSELQPAEFKARLDPALYERLQFVRWDYRTPTQRALKALISNKDFSRPRAFVVNIEALSTAQSARSAVYEFLSSSRNPMCIIDESTSIRNVSSKRTKYLLSIAHRMAYRRIMSGLVSPRSPLDLYGQFGFLDYRILGYYKYTLFKARYAVLKKVCFLGTDQLIATAARAGKPITSTMSRDEILAHLDANNIWVQKVDLEVAYKNIEELNGKIEPFSYRCLKEDCLDLPPKVYEPREVSLTDEQRRVYENVKEEAQSILASGAYVSATEKVTQLLRLHQITCGFVTDEEGRLHDLPSRRIDALLEVLNEHSGKAIIWTCYEHSLMDIVVAIRKEFGEKSVGLFYGGNRSTRSEDERRFLSDPECRFMVATPAAGGRGNTWTVATLSVYFANSHDLEHRLQSEDRNHRSGQRNSVTYIDLVSSDTIDMKIITALRKKIDIASAVQGDGWREWLI